MPAQVSRACPAGGRDWLGASGRLGVRSCKGRVAHVCLGLCGSGVSLRLLEPACPGCREALREGEQQQDCPLCRAHVLFPVPSWGAERTAVSETAGESRALGLPGARVPWGPPPSQPHRARSC